MIKVQPQLDNIIKEFPLKSSYKIMRQSASQANSFMFSQSQNMVQFEIAKQVANHSKTILELTISIFNDTGVSQIVCIPSDFCSLLSQVMVKTSQGCTIVNISNMDAYTKASMPFMIDPDTNSSAALYLCPSIRDTLFPSTVLSGDPYIDTGLISGVGGLTVLQENSVSSITSYQRYQYSYTDGTPTAVPDQSYYTKTFHVPLKNLLPDTFFRIDRDLYIDPMNFQFFFKPVQYFGFFATTATPPVTTSFKTGSISNLIMLIYQQQNDEVKKYVMENPINLIVPWVYVNEFSFQTNGTQTTNFKTVGPKANENNRLFKIYYIVVAPDNTNGAYSLTNSSNLVGNITRANSNISTTARGADIVQNPKLILNVQNFISGDQCLNFQTFQDLSAHAMSAHEHSFKGTEDYMLCSSIPTVFTTRKCGRDYDGDTLEGISLGKENSIDICHNVTTSTYYNSFASTSPLSHYMFGVTLAQASISNGIFNFV